MLLLAGLLPLHRAAPLFRLLIQQARRRKCSTQFRGGGAGAGCRGMLAAGSWMRCRFATCLMQSTSPAGNWRLSAQGPQTR